MPTSAGDAGEHIVGCQNRRATGHQLGDRAAVACPLEDLVGDQRTRLGIVEAKPTRSSPPGKFRRQEEQQAIGFFGREMHAVNLDLFRRPRLEPAIAATKRTYMFAAAVIWPTSARSFTACASPG